MALENIIGWDVGGAHLKAVELDGHGALVRAVQLPCPLWQGLQHLEQAVDRVLAHGQAARHAVTMTGELVDLFASRSEGVVAIAHTMQQKLAAKPTFFFAGEKGFVPVALCKTHAQDIASMNWYATGALAASRVAQGLLIDIGSTTTDIMLLRDGRVHARGKTDFARLAADELVYTGFVRTPLMALAQKILFQQTEVGVMAEYFATTADVYRLLGELPEEADQQPTADNNDKTLQASARRIARMVGRDMESAAIEDWQNLAQQFADKQLQQLRVACDAQFKRGMLADDAPLIGAGCGSLLVRKLAQTLQRPYTDFSEFAKATADNQMGVNICAPAYAVAALALQQWSQ